MATPDFRSIFSQPVTEEDTAKILREFDGALDTAAQRDGGNVTGLAIRVLETFQSPGISPNVKIIMALALLYFIAPWDAIPDVTPLLGYADDVLVLGYALRSIVTVAPAVQTARSKFREKYGLP